MRLYYNVDNEAALGLATVFAVICLPQIFFYGLYTILGQVLNAHGRFAGYMWAPALANIVAIAGLVWFQRAGFPTSAAPADWTPEMIAILAGSATLSIVVQALSLLVPAAPHRLPLPPGVGHPRPRPRRGQHGRQVDLRLHRRQLGWSTS